MAFVDKPKGKKKKTIDQRRGTQEACRVEPCAGMKRLDPPCVLCVHEGEIIKRMSS